MPKRKAAEMLPPQLKQWLDDELVRRGFSDYIQLAADLKAKGGDVSKSALHRYGSVFEERLARLRVSTEQARAVVAASPDDDDAMSQALLRLTQQKTMDLLIDCEIDPVKVDFNKLTLNVSRMVRASLPMKKWQTELRHKAATKLKAVEAEVDGMPKDAQAVAREMLSKVRAVYEGAI